MNKQTAIFISFLVLFSGLLLLLLFDFAALHDIQKEYISKNILEFLGIELPREIPYWTENKGEWKYLSVSMLLRFITYSIMFASIVYLFRTQDLHHKTTTSRTNREKHHSLTVERENSRQQE